METDYSFKIVTSATDASDYQLSLAITINVFAEHFGASHLCIRVVFGRNGDNYKIEGFEFQNNSSIEELEHIGFLRGYFGFAHKGELDSALHALVKTLNEKIDNIVFSTKWQEFKVQFLNWFNKQFKLYIESQIASYEILINMDS